MAMITCPECKKQVSSYADECPECGYPIDANANIEEDVPEEVLFDASPEMFREQPLLFVGLLLFPVAVAAIIVFFWPKMFSSNLTLFLGLVGGAVAISGAILLYWFLKCVSQQLKVTSQRTIYREGILSKHTNEVRHRDVRNVQIKQTLVDRLFNVGAIYISSAGQSDMEIHIKGIRAPNAVAEIIRDRQT